VRLRNVVPLAMAVLLSACSDSTRPLTASSADVVGELASINGDQRLLLRNITVSPESEKLTSVYLLVGPATELYIRTGTRIRKAAISDLMIGSKVYATLNLSIVLDSAPPQIGALVIYSDQ
jgi:hypothetical protein